MPSNLPNPDLSRRQFGRLVALMGLSAAMSACGSPEQPSSPAEMQSSSAPKPQPTTTAEMRLAHATKAQPTPAADPEPSRVAEMQPTSGTEHRPSPTPAPGAAYLAVARGGEPGALTYAALAAVGGIERFVKPGSQVIIKPNICVDYRTFEYGATTNPEVVAALVELCLGAGARRVRVMDTPFGGTAELAYERSGIAEKVTAAGGHMEVMNPAKFRETDIPEGRDITRWAVYQELLTADVLINVPVAKHHSLARLTLGGKNLLGTILHASLMHANLGQRIADLASLLRPSLTIVDAVRTLMAHGPTGGDLGDVRMTNTVIASHDLVTADAYAATLFGLTGRDIAYVKAAAEMGLGTLDLKSIRIEEIVL